MKNKGTQESFANERSVKVRKNLKKNVKEEKTNKEI